MTDPNVIEVEHLRAVVAFARSRLSADDARLADDVAAALIKNCQRVRQGSDAVDRLRAEAVAVVFAPSARASVYMDPIMSSLLSALPQTEDAVAAALGIRKVSS